MSDTTNKVRGKHWLILCALVTAVWVLAFTCANKAGAAELGDRGTLDANVSVCQVNHISPETIAMIEDNHRISTILLENDGDMTALSPQDYTRGGELYFGGCGALAQPYRIVVYKSEGEYGLMVFEERYNFEHDFYIFRLQDFYPDGKVKL